MVPHLTTALNGPLLELEQRILDASTTIERWFRLRWLSHQPPFYCSVDVRNSGFKLAPVDTNLYLGGFNNLSAACMPLAVQAATAAIEKICPAAKNLVLVPENHTRNKWYLEYGIKDTPYVAVKADAGTYGMGVMMVRDAAEVRDLNRRQRNKMAMIKEGLAVTDVIIQEGVHTMERIEEQAAEPVVYMIGRYVIGGFYRVHGARAADENLNAPGMHFVPLAFEQSCSMPDPHASCDAPPNRFYAYGVVARLALAAAGLELEKTGPAN